MATKKKHTDTMKQKTQPKRKIPKPIKSAFMKQWDAILDRKVAAINSINESVQEHDPYFALSEVVVRNLVWFCDRWNATVPGSIAKFYGPNPLRAHRPEVVIQMEHCTKWISFGPDTATRPHDPEAVAKLLAHCANLTLD